MSIMRLPSCSPGTEIGDGIILLSSDLLWILRTWRTHPPTPLMAVRCAKCQLSDWESPEEHESSLSQRLIGGCRSLSKNSFPRRNFSPLHCTTTPSASFCHSVVNKFANSVTAGGWRSFQSKGLVSISSRIDARSGQRDE